MGNNQMEMMSESEHLNQVIDGFCKVKNFTISENKVIFWSKSKIIHGNLQDIRGAED